MNREVLCYFNQKRVLLWYFATTIIPWIVAGTWHISVWIFIVNIFLTGEVIGRVLFSKDGDRIDHIKDSIRALYWIKSIPVNVSEDESLNLAMIWCGNNCSSELPLT